MKPAPQIFAKRNQREIRKKLLQVFTCVSTIFQRSLSIFTQLNLVWHKAISIEQIAMIALNIELTI